MRSDSWIDCSSWSRRLRGWAYHLVNRSAEALADANAALRLDPKHASALKLEEAARTAVQERALEA